MVGFAMGFGIGTFKFRVTQPDIISISNVEVVFYRKLVAVLKRIIS